MEVWRPGRLEGWLRVFRVAKRPGRLKEWETKLDSRCRYEGLEDRKGWKVVTREAGARNGCLAGRLEC